MRPKISSFMRLNSSRTQNLSFLLFPLFFLCKQVTDTDIEEFIEQCQNLISGTYKISCKTGEGINEMFADIANTLLQSNRSRLELQSLEQHGFRVEPDAEPNSNNCKC